LGAASLLLAQGVDQRVVMEILGHSQVSMTSKHTHVLLQGHDRRGRTNRPGTVIATLTVGRRAQRAQPAKYGSAGYGAVPSIALGGRRSPGVSW
jgi:hypothetical protein